MGTVDFSTGGKVAGVCKGCSRPTTTVKIAMLATVVNRPFVAVGHTFTELVNACDIIHVH
jgi:hypothetical protein